MDSQGSNTLSGVQEVFKKLPSELGRAFVYPNPIATDFTVDFLIPLAEDKVVVVNNNLGRPVERLTIPAGTIRYTIDASNYLPGIYTLVVDNKLEKDIMMRLVKVER